MHTKCLLFQVLERSPVRIRFNRLNSTQTQFTVQLKQLSLQNITFIVNKLKMKLHLDYILLYAIMFKSAWYIVLSFSKTLAQVAQEDIKERDVNGLMVASMFLNLAQDHLMENKNDTGFTFLANISNHYDAVCLLILDQYILGLSQCDNAHNFKIIIFFLNSYFSF